MALIPLERRIRLINFYPPYVAAGIRMTHLARDFSSCTVRMKLHWWNRNAVGTHFGGSLYAMTDPFYMLLLMGSLPASDYVIWDKAATIRFRRPGRGTVSARFEVPPERVEEIRREVAASGGRKDVHFYTEVKDEAGEVIAEVEKVVYVRRKDPAAKQ